MEDLVSIITPVYNSEKFLHETIKSVTDQTYKNWELLLIDDCSTDKSKEIIENHIKRDERIKYLKTIKNSGPAKARNIGFKQAKGKYIALLDSDDLWSEKKLEKQIGFMKKENLHISHTDYYFFKENFYDFKITVKPSNEIDYKKLLKSNQFKTMCMIFTRELLGNKEMPDRKHEDYAFFLDLIRDGAVSKKYSEVVSMCRLRNKSRSSNKIKSAIWTWKIYRDYEKINIFHSLYYFFNYVILSLKKYTRG